MLVTRTGQVQTTPEKFEMSGVERMRGKIPVAITIAGSDSGGGAGIQADLKTFAALGVHGVTVITSVTAQNTQAVKAVVGLDAEIIRMQFQAVAEDIGFDAGKTGMLYTKETIETVASEFSNYQVPLVVDPIIVAQSGDSLLKHEALDALKKCLLSKATVITPNKFEAEKLANRKIRNLEDAKTVAKEISKMGPEAVVITGGHLNLQHAVDVLYYRGNYKLFEAARLDVKTTHGSGCSFSAAVAAQLAMGKNVPLAVELAKKLTRTAIKFGFGIGRGYGPVNPLAALYGEASRYQVLENVDMARQMLESSKEVADLVPEVGMNVAMATPYPEDLDDVAAIPGRLVRVLNHLKASSYPRFGASSHLSKYILEIAQHDPNKRAAINLKLSEEALSLLQSRKLAISFYDRQEEPEDIKKIEGMTIRWGVNQAIKKIGKVPDAIYHKGDIGKEPMIVILGTQASSVAELVVQIAAEMKSP